MLKVVDRGDKRYLLFNESEQSSMSLIYPHRGGFEYQDFFHLPALLGVSVKSVLFIGLGGGSVIKSFQFHYPDAHLDVTEIHPIVAQVAKEYFAFRESDNVRLYLTDVQKFLEKHPEKSYQVIIHDAFIVLKDYIGPPPDLCTRAFYTLLQKHLEYEGMVMQNVTGFWFSPKPMQIWNEFTQAFPYAWGFNVRTSANLIFLGAQKPLLDKKTFWDMLSKMPPHPALEHISLSDFSRQLILTHPR